MARSVTILGAGLVGSLLAVLMRKHGYEVTVYERRPDMRAANMSAGKSINLAMSARGWKALDLAGLRKDIEDLAIPMTGRYLHQPDGTGAFQQYGKNNEAIYSVSRGELNKKLMSLAEEKGAKIYFEHRCNKIDVAENRVYLQDASGTEKVIEADLLFGSDGAFSALRNGYQLLDRTNLTQQYIEHGYKELSIPPDAQGNMRMEKNALHIWPRKNFMLIALPNTDGTFTCTLFLPFVGENSFEKLKTKTDVEAFFNTNFPDATPLMPTLVEDFFTNPTSSLVTIRVAPWHYKDKSALIGDAAHAIVPFYGQGMNAGFEDCTVLSELMNKYGDNWGTILEEYDKMRKPNGDAVLDLALMNFVEMRDKVAEPAFLERKKIEKELGKRYPEQFVSVYEMVSFTHIPYSTAWACIQAQDALLGTIMSAGDFFDNINKNNFCLQLDSWINDYHQSVKQLDFGHEA